MSKIGRVAQATQPQHRKTLYRATLRTPNQTMVWWSPTRDDSDRTVAQWLEDATRLTRRGTEWATVTQEAVTSHGATENLAICEVLNGLTYSQTLSSTRVERGEVAAFSRSTTATPTDDYPDVLEPETCPTPEYRHWFAWLRDEPALWHLCATARTHSQWQSALRLCGVKMPRHIAIWLHRLLTGQQT